MNQIQAANPFFQERFSMNYPHQDEPLPTLSTGLKMKSTAKHRSLFPNVVSTNNKVDTVLNNILNKESNFATGIQEYDIYMK